MPAVTYVDIKGCSKTVELPVGRSVMQGALSNGISGIVGECGGNAMCATCHVFVDPSSAATLAPRSLVEEEMLEFTACERTSASRLSCQLVADAGFQGLVVQLPEEQM